MSLLTYYSKLEEKVHNGRRYNILKQALHTFSACILCYFTQLTLALVFIYCRHKSIIVKLTVLYTLQKLKLLAAVNIRVPYFMSRRTIFFLPRVLFTKQRIWISISFKLGVTLGRHEPKLTRSTFRPDSQAKFHLDPEN